MFLGISPEVRKWNPERTEFSLYFDENPLTDFVELPVRIGKQLYELSLNVCFLISMFVISWVDLHQGLNRKSAFFLMEVS